jgi:chemotaxis methyl-accepting protein methylase
LRRLRRLLAELIGAYAGLDPPEWLLAARVAERAAELELDEERYLTLACAESGHEERARLADLLRVGETRFFRHRAHVAALRGRVLPERAQVAAVEKRPLVAWSAGCASGEEAWTLAMLLDEAAPASGWQVIATDLSDDALARARDGVYATERVSDVPARLQHRYFVALGDGRERIGDALRAHVHFERHNLLGSGYPSGCDLILCRNVLIYFDPQRRAEVISRLGRSVREGGYVFLGYSESLRDHDHLFEAIPDEDGVVYRRRARGSSSGPIPIAPLSTSGSGPKTIAPSLTLATPSLPSPPRPPTVAPPSPPVVRLRGDYHDARRLAEELRAHVAGGRAVVDLDGASFLGDEAARVLVRATEAAPGLALRATRPAVQRWLVRHRLVKP